MKSKLKIIIPIGIAIIAIALAFVFIRFTPSQKADIKAIISTAQQYITEQKFEQAIAEFKKAIEIDPRNIDAYIGIAQAYEAIGDTESALEWLHKGYDLTGDSSLKAEIDRISGLAEEVVTAAEEAVVTTVPTIAETTAAETTTSIKVQDNDDGSRFEMVYNGDGKIIHEDFYDADGKPFGSADIEYYPNGEKKRVTYYREDGSYYVEEYNEKGLKIKYTSYNADGSLYYYEDREYTDFDKLLSSISCYPDGSIRKYEKNKYDPNGYIIYSENFKSLAYNKETLTDQSRWKDETSICEMNYSDNYEIGYTYQISGGLCIMADADICYMYYDYYNNTRRYTKNVKEKDKNGVYSITRQYSGEDGVNEEYTGYSESIFDENGYFCGYRGYYKNYETGNIELMYYGDNLIDGLGNTIITTNYDKDGNVTGTYRY